jgi:hypothetical protein
MNLKNILLFCLALSFLSTELSAQLIGEISHEPFSDKVVLTYTLNGIAAHQRLEVNLYCSDDDFQNPVKSVHGNGVGAEVAGNGQKTIIWEVLRDRKSLTGLVSFELRGIVFNDLKSVSKSIEESPSQANSLEDKKSLLYADMSSSVGNFLITVKDLVSAFRKATPSIFIDDQLTLRNMSNAIIKYNDAFNKLNSDRMGYEKQVMQYWNNEALATDVRYMFDYALGELHTVNVLELNNSLNTINDIGLGKISGRKNQNEAKDKLFADIFQNTSQLEKRILELERRANRILYTLSNR